MTDVPRSKLFDDIYFSPADGRAETEHVFLKGNNLPDRFSEQDTFTICETGFGTGLNFLMAWKSFTGHHLHFISFEKYPLSRAEISRYLAPLFSREDDEDKTLLDLYLKAYPDKCEGWQEISVTDRIKMTLIFGDVNEEISKLDATVDAWFLDGFAPAKNPEMWTDVLFQNMARLSHAGTTFSTFTAAGFVKRGLQAAGFTVEKVRGFGQKREQLRGVL
ncbi:MAG: tRNA (5-methylaminomethyl-2-thiouridine)(34)-methyltransferase MnmD [Rhodospirillales bacterium]|nr:tRNA (5-methylaminomethyl-2-thiouridine)(34)-methyltransferase MnmD [Rhodospirillales bacterium]